MPYGNGSSIYKGNEQGASVLMPGMPITDRPPNVPTRVSATQAETEQLAKAIEYLTLTIIELETRLADVIVPEPPSAVGASDKAEVRPTPPVALARFIAQQSTSVQYAVTRLQSLIHRIEV